MKFQKFGEKATQNKWLASVACLSAVLVTSAFHTPTALAVEKEQANLSYNVFIGTSKMFRIGLQTTFTANSYTSYMRLKPKGLAKLFANISMVMSANGEIDKNHIKPAEFTFYRKKKRRKRTSEIVWENSGKASTNRSYRISPEKQADLSRAQNPDIPDPLTAFLRMGVSNASKPCGRSQRIYDGGKVYDLQFSLQGKTVFGPSSNGAYRGPAYKCQLRHQPVAGYSNKALAKARRNPAVFTVWFAPVMSSILQKTILLPIAATGKVKGRAFSAFTKAATFGGKPL